MKQTIFLLAILLVSVICQVMLPNILKTYKVRPDIILLVVLGIAQQKKPAAGAASGFIGGILQDNLSGALPGTGALAKTLTGFLASKSIRRFSNERILFQLAFAFIFTVLCELIFLSLKQLSEPSISLARSIQTIILPAALCNALLAPPVFWLVRKISH